MRVSMKKGMLTIGLSKPEIKKLTDAIDLCQLVMTISPIDEKVKAEATDAAGHLVALGKLCTKQEPPMPLFENLPDEDTGASDAI